MGRGMLATEDIKEGEVLFEMPRSMLLNLQTTTLPYTLKATGNKEAIQRWSKMQEEGWAPLILAMMWEDYHASTTVKQVEGSTQQTWGPYFDIMPREFSTPMFWPEADLDHLRGTSIENKLGRDEAEATYHEKVLPFVQSMPQVFGGIDGDSDWFSLERYHMMASRILSRSFHVKRQVKGIEAETHNSAEDEENGTNNDGEEYEHVGDISMVPMADMLNARSGSDNIRLFYKPQVLEMRATKDILAGEQIFNTYADPPNSDLLRRYGHVDEPNENDIVEIDASLICVNTERLQWACETFGMDEVFSINPPFEVDDEMIVLAKIASMSKEEYTNAARQEKCPSPRLEATTNVQAVCQLIAEALTKRMKQIPQLDATNDNQRRARVVRQGERRILEQYRTAFQELLAEMTEETKTSHSAAKKRKR